MGKENPIGCPLCKPWLADNPKAATYGCQLHDATLQMQRLANLTMRQFETGATRDTNAGKLEYRRFLSMPALHRYCMYMHKHRQQADGSLRDPDNWKKGIPKNVYADSLYRHVQELAEKIELKDVYDEDTLCAIIFNAMGLLHECLKPIETSQLDWNCYDLSCPHFGVMHAHAQVKG